MFKEGLSAFLSLYIFRSAFKVLLLTTVFVSMAFSSADQNQDPVAMVMPEDIYSTNRYILFNELSDIKEMSSIDTEMETFLKRWQIKGASVAVAKKGKLVYAKGFGYTDLDTEERVEPYHLFRIASVSKLITAAAIMRLYDEDLLELDAPVFGDRGILNTPQYSNIKDKNFYDVTIRHLLQHTAGFTSRIPDPMFNPQLVANALDVALPIDESATIQYVLTQRLPFKPGTKYTYSNVGYVMLGKIIETISGMSYENYVQTALLEPLGIYGMRIGKNLYEEKFEEEVKYYDHEGALERLSCYGTGEMMPRTYGGTNIEALGAAGGWVATPTQMMRLMLALDGFKSKPDILSKRALKEMTTPGDISNTVMGWRGCNDGRWWRTGTLAGSSAMLVRYEDETAYMVVLNTSTWNGARFTGEINRAMTKALDKVEKWPAHDLFDHYQLETLAPIGPKFHDL